MSVRFVADRAAVGLFYLKGHGIPQAVIDRTMAESKRFNELPLETKMAIPLVNNRVIRTGYQPSEFSLQADAELNIIKGAKPDLNDFLSINREPAASELYRIKNVWPDLPGFREAVLDYHARMESLAMKFLPLWATSLDLPPDYFDKFFTDPQLTLSLVHYAPQKEIGDRQYGIAPHADSTFMTLLAQAGEPALAVQMPSGHWRMVDVIPGTLLVNTGSTIARWTNDRYLSTKHRVINTSNVDRYSLAAFFGPNAEAMIQEQAARALLSHDAGVFVAPPGVGKTVVGTYLVAARGRSTLVLVHRQPLLDQWIAQLGMFLGLDPNAVGQIGAGKRKPTGRLDVAMLQSLVREGRVDEVVAGYGHVIVDECHHVPAVSFERVLSEVKARYLTGLTATPRRRDGLVATPSSPRSSSRRRP